MVQLDRQPLGVCAGGGEISGEVGPPPGEVRSLLRGAAVGVGGLGSQRAQSVPALLGCGYEPSGGLCCAFGHPRCPDGFTPGRFLRVFELVRDPRPTAAASVIRASRARDAAILSRSRKSLRKSSATALRRAASRTSRVLAWEVRSTR